MVQRPLLQALQDSDGRCWAVSVDTSIAPSPTQASHLRCRQAPGTNIPMLSFDHMPGLGLSNLFPRQTSLTSLSDFIRLPLQLPQCRRRERANSQTDQQLLTICAAAAQETRRALHTGKRKRSRLFIQSDGKEHLGSALERQPNRPFPGPPSGEGPPLRILPVGGLGEIGMNCMLVGVYDRYILIDAGLMFPDFSDLGMNKILPDTTFLAEWRDKIEAVIITHGHEDHIGALPWVIPALDPNTPIYAGAFTMQLVRRRLQEFNLFSEQRFHTFKMLDKFQAGPFEIQPLRVTHSIPDCCGLILRSEHGSIVHTGDWKIEEDPVDGQKFDRSIFEDIGKEGATLFMSDSTNVLSPGRTVSEASVEQRIMQRVMGHQGKGRVIATQFASNIHRLAAVKKAADAANRRMCFVGMSLNTYLEAAALEGAAPFDPKELIPVSDLESHDPNQVLIVTTGSQAEPRAALCLASREASPVLKLSPTDLLLYSAKIIPGNDTKVMSMMNNASALGVEIAMGSSEGLHTSGHAYRDELEEVMKLVKPQHFLPVHGEYAFLTAHAQLAQDIGIRNTSVIRNGQMLGVHHRRNGNVVSTTGASIRGMQLLGDVKLRMLYNDGNKGTGSDEEMGIEERQQLALEGIVVAAVDVVRSGVTGAPPPEPLPSPSEASPAQKPAHMKAQIRVTTRAMWVDNGRLLEILHKVADASVKRLPADASLVAVERAVADAIRRACKDFNQRRPDVIVIAHEMDPREGAAARASLLRRKTIQATKQAQNQQRQLQHQQQQQQSLQHQRQSEQQQQQQQHPQQRQQEQQKQQQVQQKQQQVQQQQLQQQHKAKEAAKQSLQQDSASKAAAPEKKRRGRPRKADSVSASLDSVDMTGDDEAGTEGSKPVRRRGRPRKNAATDNASHQTLNVREADVEMLRKRKAANPRETAKAGDDVAYD